MTAAPTPTAAAFVGAVDLDCELLVLGAGPGGYSAAFRAADSQAVRLPFMPEDPRVVDSPHALALKEVPKRMLILGCDIIVTHVGDMIGEIALAIEMGTDALDIGKTIHAHPTLGESIGVAAEVAHGS